MTGRGKALIIAVDEYEHPGLRRLPSPAADAAALAAALGDPRIGAFEVSVVRNQTAYEIQSRLGGPLRQCEAGRRPAPVRLGSWPQG